MERGIFASGFTPETGVAGLGFPAFPEPGRALTLAVLAQLAASQWWSEAQLRDQQLGQLGLLLSHAARHTRHGRQTLDGIDRAPLTWERFREIPVTSRRTVQERLRAMVSEACPPEHGRVAVVRTSGSTGAPVVVHRTEATQVMWVAMTARDHLWHRRDTSGLLASIRNAPEVGSGGSEGPTWGRAAALVGPPGPCHVLHIAATTEAQLAWLVERDPAYVLAYPSSLRDLVRACAARDLRLPSLRAVMTMGEVVDEALRDDVRAVWGVAIEDMYSIQEVGYLALQCPDGPGYHVQSEGVVLEVLRDDGTPCATGEVGRVVVTALHNFAMPLVRYEIGDLAEVGAPCPCGRGLPVLTRVLGRVRNTWAFPDGDRRWLTFGSRRLQELLPLVQHQFVQRGYDRLEARLVTARPPTPDEEEAVVAHLRGKVPPGVTVTLSFVQAIERSPSGKFEDFVSDV